MSKSKFQSEKDKQESILNCIGSITGNLTEAVISGFNPSISNKRNSQQSPSFNQTASSPTFNQTASSPTFNQTASSPTFNPTAAAAPTINQNPSSVQDVWNRLLLPKKQQSPTSNPTASSPTFNQTASSPTFNQTASSPKFNSSVAPEAEETENKDTDTMDLSDQIKAHNSRVAALSRNPKSPNFVGPPAPGKKQRDTIGSNLYGNPVVNGVEMDSPLNNPRTVPFTPDFSGDAPPNLNLGSSGNKAQPVAPAVPTTASLGYGASVRTPNASSPVNPTQKTKDDFNKYFKKPSVGPPSSLKDPEQDKDFVGPPSRRLGGAEDVAAGIVNKQNTIGTPNTTGNSVAPTFKNQDGTPNTTSPSVRTPPAVSTSKNSQTPMRGDEDQGTSETNQMITPNYSDQAQHQDMFAGTLQGRPETDKQNFLGTPDTTGDSVGPPSSSRRPGGAEDVAAGIVNKQDTIGTPDTTGTTVFTSKTGDFVAKPQNNNPATNPGFMTSPQGAPASNSNQTEKQRSDDLKSVSKNPNTLFSDPSLSLKDQFAANRKSKNPNVVSSQKIVDDMNIQTQSDKQIGSDGRTIGAMRKENEQYAQAARNRGEPLPIGGPEWVAWNRAKNQKRLDDAGINKTVDQVVRGDNASPSAEEERRSNYDPKEITRFNSQLARDRQQGILRPGERYKGTPGVGSLEDSRRGRVGLDALGDQSRFQFKETPAQTKQRYLDARQGLKDDGYEFDEANYDENNILGGMYSRGESAAIRADRKQNEKNPKGTAPTTTNRDAFLAQQIIDRDPVKVAARKNKAAADRKVRDENNAQRETADHEKNLLRLQRRTDLTNARNALEDSQNRKTSSGWNMSSASSGSGGGGAGQPPANTIKADADEMLKNMKDNRPEPITYPGVPHASSGKTMKSGTLIAELFDGDFRLSDFKDAYAAVGTLATPPEELLYTTGGVMGRSGYTRQGASKRTKHYQDILNSVADLGVNGLANTVGQAFPKTTAGVINNTVYPATKVAANMLTRMLYDPRSDEDGDEVSLSFEDAKKKKKEEEEKEAAESETAPAKTRTKTKKSGTPVSPEGNPTGINPDTGNTWAKSDTNPVFGLANKIKPKTQQIQWNPYKANFSQQQSRAAAE